MNRRIWLGGVVLACATAAYAEFAQQGPKLVAAEGFLEGNSVAISGDGNTAIIGGGPAFIWSRSGGVWSQQSPRLEGSGAVPGIRDNTTAVAISADGNTAIVGVPRDNNSVGAAWIWIRSGNAWIQQGPKLVASDAVMTGGDIGGHQGASVSLSADGNTAIIGSPADNHNAGAVWIWGRGGEVWTQQTLKLVGSGAIGNAWQGTSVALSADGNTAIVGAPGDNGDIHGDAGAAWVWTRSGGLWRQQSKLAGAVRSRAAGQGQSVALSADGNTALVGGPGDESVWVWIRNGEVWTQQGETLFFRDLSQFNQAKSFPGGLGFSVSLSADGNTALIGAPLLAGPQPDPSTGLVDGSAWIWIRSGGVWHQQAGNLIGVDGAEASQGTSVALSADGKTAIVGGYSDRRFLGAAWVFAAGGVPASAPRRRSIKH